MYQFVVGGSKKWAAGMPAKSGVVYQRLRVFDPYPNRKRFALHEHAALIKHMKCIACAMTNRQYDVIGNDDFAALQRHRTGLTRVTLGGRDVDTGDPRSEPIFAT